MRKLLVTIVMLLCSKLMMAQMDATSVAARIAQRMKDSLSLSEDQRVHLFAANVNLNNAKIAARQQGSQQADSTRIRVQRAENRRDSLYKNILTTAQFEDYLEKKYKLIRAD